MKRLDCGVPDLKLKPKRNQTKVTALDLSSINQDKVIEAQTNRQHIASRYFDKVTARDDSMFRDTDRLLNFQLDHSKPKRELELHTRSVVKKELSTTWP